MLSTDIDIEASAGLFDRHDGYTQHHGSLEIWKTVDDMERYRRILEADQPDVVIETGTRTGGFAAWMADTFGVRVITVEASRHPARPTTWPSVTFIEGDSAAMKTVHGVVHALTNTCVELGGYRRVMVTLDSDHHYHHVRNEIKAYGGLVSPGCHLVVEDGLADLANEACARRIGYGIPEQGGPLKAIEEVLHRRPERWVRNLDVENLTKLSHSPAGWWRRMG